MMNDITADLCVECDGAECDGAMSFKIHNSKFIINLGLAFQRKARKMFVPVRLRAGDHNSLLRTAVSEPKAMRRTHAFV